MGEANSTIICLDSSDDDDVVEVVYPPSICSSSNVEPKNEAPSIRRSPSAEQTIEPPSIGCSQSPEQTIELQENQKRFSNEGCKDGQKKRLKLTTLSTCVSRKWIEDDFEVEFLSPVPNNNQNAIDDEKQPPSTANIVQKPITESFAKFIDACHQADPTDDMANVINNKLLKYYHMVDSTVIDSDNFERIVISMTKEIQSNKKTVYTKLGKVLEQLNVEKDSVTSCSDSENQQKEIVQTDDVTNEDTFITDDETNDDRVKLLHSELYKLKKKIAALHTTDFDMHDDETYLLRIQLLCERYQQRACQIYEKICEITGTLVEEPIKFKATKYPQINKKLQALVNQKYEFPVLTDVIRIVKGCNKRHKLKLNEDEITRTSEDAYYSIGNALHKRRKNDFEQMIHYFAPEIDPAIKDPKLKAKLEGNSKYYSRIDAIINQYAVMQDTYSENELQPSSDNDADI